MGGCQGLGSGERGQGFGLGRGEVLWVDGGGGSLAVCVDRQIRSSVLPLQMGRLRPREGNELPERRGTSIRASHHCSRLQCSLGHEREYVSLRGYGWGEGPGFSLWLRVTWPRGTRDKSIRY